MLDQSTALVITDLLTELDILKAVDHWSADRIHKLNNAVATLASIGRGDTIASLWGIDDVFSLVEDHEGNRDPKISVSQARRALASAEANHDAEYGINWDSLRDALYGVLEDDNEDPRGGDGNDD